MNATMTGFTVELKNGWSFVVVSAANDDVRLVDSDGNYWDVYGRCGSTDRSNSPVRHLSEMLQAGFAEAFSESRRRDKKELELSMIRNDEMIPSLDSMYRDWSENPDSTY